MSLSPTRMAQRNEPIPCDCSRSGNDALRPRCLSGRVLPATMETRRILLFHGVVASPTGANTMKPITLVSSLALAATFFSAAAGAQTGRPAEAPDAIARSSSAIDTSQDPAGSYAHYL